jgi:hypothetical protein
MSEIKPFKKIAEAPRNKIATRKWVARFLSLVLGKLNLTGKGIKITPAADGHLHFELDSVSGSDSPFYVSAVSGGFEVNPGLVYSTSGGWRVPKIGGSLLTNNPAPTIAWSADQAFICLLVKFDSFGVAIDSPWEIKAFATLPPDITVLRSNGLSLTPRNGTYHVLIASRLAGTLHQWVRHNIIVNLQWENLFVWG